MKQLTSGSEAERAERDRPLSDAAQVGRQRSSDDAAAARRRRSQPAGDGSGGGRSAGHAGRRSSKTRLLRLRFENQEFSESHSDAASSLAPGASRASRRCRRPSRPSGRRRRRARRHPRSTIPDLQPQRLRADLDRFVGNRRRVFRPPEHVDDVDRLGDVRRARRTRCSPRISVSRGLTGMTW